MISEAVAQDGAWEQQKRFFWIVKITRDTVVKEATVDRTAAESEISANLQVQEADLNLSLGVLKGEIEDKRWRGTPYR